MIRATFDRVYFEISTLCNARCPYCITGRQQGVRQRSFTLVNTFSQIVTELHKKGYVRDGGIVDLYVWGEPFLHPEFSALMDCCSELPVYYGISTNGSVLPNITKSFVDKISEMRFSCPGFSQSSYDRIHGFKADKVRDNIRRIVDSVRQKNGKTKFHINYHLYQFNVDEVKYAWDFADSLEIDLRINYAIINDWDLTRRWVEKNLSAQEWFELGRDLFSHHAAALLMNAPDEYTCPQYKYLVLDVAGNVCICCQTPHSQLFTVGNILDDTSDEAIQKRMQGEVCRQCINSKQAYVMNNSLACPKWLSR